MTKENEKGRASASPDREHKRGNEYENKRIEVVDLIPRQSESQPSDLKKSEMVLGGSPAHLRGKMNDY